MDGKNRGWVLESYPVGNDFGAALKLRDTPMPEPGANQMLVRSQYLSLDPANRGWMLMPTYIPQVPLGATMWGFVLGRVERSNLAGFAPGDLVSGFGAWADYCVMGAEMTNKAPDLGGLPLYAAQSLFGLSGGTAYVGVMDIAKAKAGDVFLVSGAAGSAEKCRWLVDELGFDHAIDYRKEDVGARLSELCPKGVDIYFDNVGGPLTNTIAMRMALHGRIVLCGSMAKFENPGPELDLGAILMNRLTMTGFILIDHFDRLDAANAALAKWAAEGKLKHHADIVDGLERAVEAFGTLFTPGAPHMGKLLVKIDPAAN